MLGMGMSVWPFLADQAGRLKLSIRTRQPKLHAIKYISSGFFCDTAEYANSAEAGRDISLADNTALELLSL